MACGTFMQKTQDLLVKRSRTLTLEKIHEDCPALNVRWLSDFANKRIEEPSVNKIQMLFEYLTGEPIVFVNNDNITA